MVGVTNPVIAIAEVNVIVCPFVAKLVCADPLAVHPMLVISPPVGAQSGLVEAVRFAPLSDAAEKLPAWSTDATVLPLAFQSVKSAVGEAAGLDTICAIVEALLASISS
jgi:hypothetical protein